MPPHKDGDRGWSWVVLIFSFISLMLNGTLISCSGVIHLELLKEFKESDTFTSFTGSVYSSLVYVSAPVVSFLMNAFSCRTTMIVGGILVSVGFSLSFFAKSLTFVLLSYGVTAGIGNGFNATPPIVFIGYFADSKRSLAVGVALSGAGLGMLISGPLVQMLINIYGLHGAFLLLGGLGANQIVMGALMRPSDNELRHQRTLKESSVKRQRKLVHGMFQFSILQDKAFLLILTQFLFWTIPVSLLFLHLPNNAVTEGATANEAAFLLLIIGLNGTVGRLVSGLASGPNGIDPVLMNLGQTGTTGIATLLFPLFSSSYIGQCVYASILGFYQGGLASTMTPLFVEILGISKLSSAYGVMFFIGGIGFIIGPTLAGFIIDTGSSYQLCFYISGASMVLSSLFTLLTALCRHRQDEDSVEKNSVDLKISKLLSQSSSIAGSMLVINIDTDEKCKSRDSDPDIQVHKADDNLIISNCAGKVQEPLLTCS